MEEQALSRGDKITLFISTVVIIWAMFHAGE